MNALRTVILQLCCASAVFAQAQGSADRPIAENPQTARFIDRLLSMVGPSDPKALTAKQRFGQYVLNTVGPSPILGEAISAGLNQWADTPHEWGQGWGAYGKRYAGNLGYNAVRQTIAYGASELFHEDTRYFASREQGTGRRIRHALTSTFLARHPDGSRRFSISSVAGVVGAAAVQTQWGPPSMQTARSVAANSAISFASSAGLNLVREFLPDILHRNH